MLEPFYVQNRTPGPIETVAAWALELIWGVFADKKSPLLNEIQT